MSPAPDEPVTAEAGTRRVTPLIASIGAIVVAGLLLALLAWAAPVVTPPLVAIFIATLAWPLFARLRRGGASAGVAVALTVVVVVIAGVGLVLLALTSAAALTSGLATYADDLAARYPELAMTLASLGLDDALAGVLSADGLADLLGAVARLVADLVGTLIYAFVLAALLLLDSDRLASISGGRIRARHPFVATVPQVLGAAITYFAVRIRVNAVTAAGMLALFVLLGIDQPLLWAVGVFFLSFVPYIGLVVALIPPTVLAFAESGTGAALVVIVAGTILNLLAENVLEPTLTGRALHLATWVVFVSFFFWAWVLGPIGALLSMPITVLIVLALDSREETRWLAAVLGRVGAPVASPDRARESAAPVDAGQ